MNHSDKQWLLNAVRDITVAKMSNSNMAASQEGGKHVSGFMEEIYNKLHDLIDKDCDNQ